MSLWNQPTNNNNNMMMGGASVSPYPNMYQNWTPQPQRLPVYHAEPIHGENAAWQFPMGPNSEIYLPDADIDVIWWIRTDAQGNKLVKRLNVIIPEDPKPIDLNDILARLSAVEEQLNGKQNKSNAKRPNANANTTATESVN